MHVDDIMTKDFGIVADSASLQQAAALMGERETDVLAVGDRQHIAGTLSWRDLAIGGCAQGRDPRSTPVSAVMTRSVVFCSLEAELPATLEKMERARLDALFVTGASDRVVGVVTRRRVLEALAHPDDQPRGPVPEQVKRMRGEPW